MSVVAGPLFAAALLVAVAGVAKLSRPDPARVALRTAGLPSSSAVVRILGAGELVVAAGVLLLGGRIAGAAVAAAYAGFAAFSARLASQSRRAVPCGCFGSSSAPVGPLHVVVNGVLALVGLVGTVWPCEAALTVLRGTPWAGVPFAGFTLLLTWLLLVTLTALPELQAVARTGRVAHR